MYLYKSWDDSLYLTELFDGGEGLITEITSDLSFGDLIEHAEGNVNAARDMARVFVGEEPQVLELFL